MLLRGPSGQCPLDPSTKAKICLLPLCEPPAFAQSSRNFTHSLPLGRRGHLALFFHCHSWQIRATGRGLRNRPRPTRRGGVTRATTFPLVGSPACLQCPAFLPRLRTTAHSCSGGLTGPAGQQPASGPLRTHYGFRAPGSIHGGPSSLNITGHACKVQVVEFPP